jgi:hypothetical protein
MPQQQEPSKVESAGHRSVAIGGYNSGMVITGDVNIFQFFHRSSGTIGQYIRTREFETLVAARTKDFIGRSFIFDAIDQALNNTQHFPSGYIVVNGEPGIGKTSLLARLVKQNNFIHHFNIATQNIRTAKDFLGNVCAQIITAYGLEYSTLPDNATRDSGFLSSLLLQAVAKSNGKPVVIVIDALDEAEDDGLPPDVNRLFLPSVLPEGVFFLVSTRPQYDYRLDVDNKKEIPIESGGLQNREDIQQYIENFVEQNADSMLPAITHWDLTKEQFVQTLMDKSEGNFMYLVYVLQDIAKGFINPHNIDHVSRLPQGLKGYYQRHWRSMQHNEPDRFRNYYEPVVCMLATAREPVSIIQIVEWTRRQWPQLSAGEIEKVIRSWREFLTEDESLEPPTYRIYHYSFQNFLRKEVDLTLYDAIIASNALDKIPGF